MRYGAMTVPCCVICNGEMGERFERPTSAPASQLFLWKKRLREAGAGKFVEIAFNRAVETAAGGSGIEVRLNVGRSLFVEPGFDANHLRALLAVLETRP
jgi:hypothetical protein